MSTRTGKIARLSHHFREELNLRLRDNHPFTDILPRSNKARQAHTRPDKV